MLAGYGIRAARTAFPLLNLGLFRIRTFRAAVSGGFFTRLGLGGIPFLFPLLYQIGLGFSPIQSGLLVLPQAIASIGMKTLMPAILARLGYRNVLVGNTILVGLMIMSFSTVGADTPIWRILAAGLRPRLLHLHAVHQHEHAGVCRRPGPQTGGASTIAADRPAARDQLRRGRRRLDRRPLRSTEMHSHPDAIIHGTQQAFLALGLLTMLSSVVFMELRADDGADLSRHAAGPRLPARQ